LSQARQPSVGARRLTISFSGAQKDAAPYAGRSAQERNGKTMSI